MRRRHLSRIVFSQVPREIADARFSDREGAPPDSGSRLHQSQFFPSTGATLAAIAGLLVVAGVALFFFLRTPRGEGETNSIAVSRCYQDHRPRCEYISDGITEA